MNRHLNRIPYSSNPDPKPETFSLRDFLNVLFRRKKEFMLVSIAAFSATLFYAFTSPKIYQSEAKVLIRVGRESLALDPTIDGPTVSLSQSRESEVNSELAIIKSRQLAEQVVDKITPENFLNEGESDSGDTGKPAFFTSGITIIKNALKKGASSSNQDKLPPEVKVRENAITKMADHLKVATETKSNVITISFEAQKPNFGQEVLTTFLELYQDHHIKVHSTHAPPQFFQEQTDKLSMKLKDQEDALEEFRAAHNIASIDIQKQTLFAQISQIENEIADINSRIAAANAQNASLEEGLRGRSREVELGRVAGRKNNTTDAIKARLFDFRIKEADLSSRYPDNHRELIEVREKIRLAEEALRSEKQSDEISTGIDPTYQALQLSLETGRAQLQAQIARRETLTEDLERPRAELAALVKNELVEARMKRDLKLLEDEYLRFRQDMQRTNISRAMDLDKVSNLSIIQPASMPLAPIRPKKALILAVGLILGLFSSTTLAFLLEYSDDSLKTNEDVEKRLGLPVLASIPFEESHLCI